MVALSALGGAGWQFFDDNGTPLSGGKLYSYAAGTTTPLTTYTARNGLTPNPNPIVLDSAGRVPAEMWLIEATYYKFVLEDANGVLIWTKDNLFGLTAIEAISATTVDYTPPYTGGTLTNVAAKLSQYISVKDFGAVGDGLTNDAPAVQAALNYIAPLGGTLFFPRGRYLFTSQVTIDRTYAANPGGGFIGERNLIISGYGVEILTQNAISAFDVRGGWIPNHNCLIEGFTIYHRNNSTAVGGIRMYDAELVTCRDISVVVSSALPVGYAAFSLENSVPSNPDTGCFWCVIESCSIRPWAGAEGFCTYGVKMLGAANATTIRGCTFSGSNTHIYITSHPGETYAANSTNIDGNFFEGPVTGTGIDLRSVAPTYHVSGTRITNNRFEGLSIAVTLTGTAIAVGLPTYLCGNYADTSVATYLVNTLNVPVTTLDTVIVGADMPAVGIHNQKGVVIRNDNAAFDAVTLRLPNLNSGIKLQTFSGGTLGTWRWGSIGGNSGTIIGGSFSPSFNPISVVACYGLSINDTPARNLANLATFSATTTVNVTLPTPEANANYSIFLENTGNRTMWVTNKTATGFTINCSASISGQIAWLLIRTGA
jgi:hypothetical protein